VAAPELGSVRELRAAGWLPGRGRRAIERIEQAVDAGAFEVERQLPAARRALVRVGCQEVEAADDRGVVGDDDLGMAAGDLNEASVSRCDVGLQLGSLGNVKGRLGEDDRCRPVEQLEALKA